MAFVMPVNVGEHEYIEPAKEPVKSNFIMPKYVGEDPGYAENKIRNELLKKQAEDTNALEAFAVSAGKGLYDIGRGVGLVDQPDQNEQSAYKALEEEHPIATTTGEIVGQSAPFILPGAGIGAVSGLGARTALATGLGAAEGAIISRGTGGDALDIASSAGIGGIIGGVAERLFPKLGKLLGKLKKSRLVNPDGTPTPDMQGALDEAGVSWEYLKQKTQDFVAKQHPSSSPEEVARLARFENIGSPATQGQITKDFAQQKGEEQLLQSATDNSADPLRQLSLNQSRAIKGELESIGDDLGITGNTGDVVKKALNKRKDALQKKNRTLYDDLAKEAEPFGGIPISGDPLLDSLPDKGTVRSIQSMAGSPYNALSDAMIEFGIDRSEDAVENFKKTGIEITPLSIENFERLRQRIKGIERGDPTGAIYTLTSPIMKSLDNEVDMVAERLAESGNPNIAKIAKKARSAYRKYKNEFDEKKITSKLIDFAGRNSTQPKIEASKAYKKIMAPTAPIEDLQRTMLSLKKSGNAGQKAIKEMKGKAVLDLLDASFNAQSRQVSGERTFGATPFSKLHEKLSPKYKELFKNDKAGLNRLNNVYKIAQDMIVDNRAVPKGSAGFFIDVGNETGLFNLLRKFPSVSTMMDLYNVIKKRGADGAVLRKAIDSRPRLKQAATDIMRDYPDLAKTMGITALDEDE